MSKRTVTMLSSLACVDYVLPIELWASILLLMYHQPPGLFGHLCACVRSLFLVDARDVFMTYIIPSIQWLPVKPLLSNELLAHCRGLGHLRLCEWHLREPEHLERLCNIESLELDLALLPTMGGLPHLPKLRKLRIIDPPTTLCYEHLQAGICRSLAQLTALCQLSCGFCIDDSTLAKLTNLRALELKKSPLCGTSIQMLPNLTSLRIEQCAFISSTLVASLTNLRSLSLSNNANNPNFILDELCVLTQLESIVVATRSTGSVLAFLVKHWDRSKFRVTDLHTTHYANYLK